MSLPFSSLLLLTIPMLGGPISAQEPGGSWVTSNTFLGVSVDEQFGRDADWVGDVDGDGYADLLIGSSNYNTGDPIRIGRVALVSGFDGGLIWSLTADQIPGFQRLGWRVTRMGDVTGDGVSDFAFLVQVGSGLTPQYVQVVDGFTLLDLYSMQPIGNAVNYGIGGIAGGTDLSGDGVPDLTVVDDNFSGALSGQGSVYAYSGVDGSLLWQAVGAVSSQRLGGSLACPGDLNGDGFADVLVDSDLGGSLGSVHVLSGLDGSEMYSFFGGYSGAFAGGDMSWIGDWDKDGFPDYLVGSAPSGSIKGFGIVYRGYDGLELARFEGLEQNTRFGTRLAGVGDIDGDGYVDAAIGAPNADGLAGAVYVYSGRDGLLLKKLSGSVDSKFFGDPVLSQGSDISGDGVVDLGISSIAESPSGFSQTGAVYTISFTPFLTSTSTTLSSAAGGSVDFHLAFPASEANLPYRFLASRNQPGGAITVGGVGIPLVDSPILRRMVNAPPSAFQTATGTLDANAQATVTLTLPPGVATPYLGKTLKFAAVSLSGLTPSLSSAPVYLEVLP